MSKLKMTSMWISKNNKERIEALGHYKETHNDILNRVLDIFEFKRADELTGAKNGGNHNK